MMAIAPNKMVAPRNGSVPNPDPTDRTIEQLLREIATSRKIVEAKINGNHEVLETRLGGYDTAIQLIQAASDRIPVHIKAEVQHLRDLSREELNGVRIKIDEGFAGIEKQFSERDKRTEQLSLADKTAINAALAAQEKQAIAQNEGNTTANNKMENNFTKLIEQNQTLLETVTKNTEAQIGDLKSRLDKGEGKTSVSDPSIAEALQKMAAMITSLRETNATHEGRSKGVNDLAGWIVGAAGFVSTVIAVIFLVMKP